MSQDILHAREKRWELRCTLARQGAKALLSLGLNLPGLVKNTPLSDRAFILIKDYVSAALASNFAPVLFGADCVVHSVDGPFWHIQLDIDPMQVKAFCINLEEALSFGRLLDLDVLDRQCQSISRDIMGLPMRPCFICGDPAMECRIGGKHPSQEVIAAAQNLCTLAINELEK